jgi:hypothetical protein
MTLRCILFGEDHPYMPGLPDWLQVGISLWKLLIHLAGNSGEDASIDVHAHAQSKPDFFCQKMKNGKRQLSI